MAVDQPLGEQLVSNNCNTLEYRVRRLRLDLSQLKQFSLDSGLSSQFEEEVDKVATLQEFIVLLAKENAQEVDKALEEWSKVYQPNNPVVSSRPAAPPTPHRKVSLKELLHQQSPEPEVSSESTQAESNSKLYCNVCPALLAPQFSDNTISQRIPDPFSSSAEPQLCVDTSLPKVEESSNGNDNSNHGEDGGSVFFQLPQQMSNQIIVDEASTTAPRESHGFHHRKGYCATLTKECPGVKCVHCGYLLRDPVQTGDGDRLCRACYLEILRMPGPCPDCGRSVGVHSCVFSDEAVAKVLDDLPVYCLFKQHGCDWVGPLKEWDSHCAQCDKSRDFLWRIPDIAEKQKTSLYFDSPSFYAGSCGYKLCCRLCLNGNGIGLGTHLSLFIVVMKGEYDSFLPWPFKHKVSLILQDQIHDEHIVQTFKPIPDSSSFQRPLSDMNVASGFSQFASIDVLHDDRYVKDDAIFIKCMVDNCNIFHP